MAFCPWPGAQCGYAIQCDRPIFRHCGLWGSTRRHLFCLSDSSCRLQLFPKERARRVAFIHYVNSFWLFLGIGRTPRSLYRTRDGKRMCWRAPALIPDLTVLVRPAKKLSLAPSIAAPDAQYLSICQPSMHTGFGFPIFPLRLFCLFGRKGRGGLFRVPNCCHRIGAQVHHAKFVHGFGGQFAHVLYGSLVPGHRSSPHRSTVRQNLKNVVGTFHAQQA
jgi:hypothetical protein